MRVKVLGSAARGRIPAVELWLRELRTVRQAVRTSMPRTQAQAAVTEDDESWFLLNASPDLRQQILATPEFAPVAGERGSPISGAVLTSADVDAVVGLIAPAGISSATSLLHLGCAANSDGNEQHVSRARTIEAAGAMARYCPRNEAAAGGIGTFVHSGSARRRLS